jgi:hypothetical protein
VGWDGVHLVRRPLYRPGMVGGDDEREAVGGMIGSVNWSTRRRPVSVPLCLPQIPCDLTRVGTQAATIENKELTAWGIARSITAVAFNFELINSVAFRCFITKFW